MSEVPPIPAKYREHYEALVIAMRVIDELGVRPSQVGIWYEPNTALFCAGWPYDLHAEGPNPIAACQNLQERLEREARP